MNSCPFDQTQPRRHSTALENPDAGKIRHMGVSNFTRARLERAADATDVPIAANQVELHPYLMQPKLLAYCKEHGIALTAYCPLARGKAVSDPVLQEIGKAHDKSGAQVALRWLLQKGILMIPKASSIERIQANMDIEDWSLTEEQMARIDAFERGERICDWEPAAFHEDDD